MQTEHKTLLDDDNGGEIQILLNKINKKNCLQVESKYHSLLIFDNLEICGYNYDKVLYKRKLIGYNVYLKNIFKKYPNHIFVIVPHFECRNIRQHIVDQIVTHTHYVYLYSEWIKTPIGHKYLDTYGIFNLVKLASNVFHVPLALLHSIKIEDKLKYNSLDYINTITKYG